MTEEDKRNLRNGTISFTAASILTLPLQWIVAARQNPENTQTTRQLLGTLKTTQGMQHAMKTIVPTALMSPIQAFSLLGVAKFIMGRCGEDCSTEKKAFLGGSGAAIVEGVTGPIQQAILNTWDNRSSICPPNTTTQQILKNHGRSISLTIIKNVPANFLTFYAILKLIEISSAPTTSFSRVSAQATTKSLEHKTALYSAHEFEKELNKRLENRRDKKNTENFANFFGPLAVSPFTVLLSALHRITITSEKPPLQTTINTLQQRGLGFF